MEIIAIAPGFFAAWRIDEDADMSLIRSLVGREARVAVDSVGDI